MSISITTETEAAASLGLNPGDLLPPDDAASTRLNLTLETVELGRQEEAARREAARDFPWRHDKQVAYDQATLDLQMYRMLHEEAESPAKRETLGQYRDYRRRRGEESFTYLEAGQQRERDRNFRQQMPVLLKMFSGTEGFTSAFPDEQKQALEQTFASSLDPDADKRATANKMLVMAMTGRKVDPEGWPVLRTRYAQAAFGWQGAPASPGDGRVAGAASRIISEETFYQLAGQSLEQQTKEQEQSEEIFRRSMRAAFKGLPLDEGYTVAGEVAGDDSKRYEGAVRQGYAAILADYTDEEIRHGRELFEMFSKQEDFKTDDVLPGGEFELTLAYARASQATRDKMMNVAWLNADAEAVDVTNYFSRLAAAMGYSARSMYDFLESGEIGRESAAFDRILEKGLVPTGTPVGDIRRLLKLRARDLERVVQLGILKEWEIVEPGQRPKELQSLRWMTPEERKQMEDFRDLTKGVSLIAADSRTAGLRVKNYIDDKREGFWDTAGDWGVIGAESTVPMVFASASYGMGLPALIESNRVRNASNYRRAGLPT